tara:strand:- start:133 stop:606 length:474 start_codon:yes stop_codon:yes gene_type:complete
MDNNYLNFYNNLVNLTRNKSLYENFTKHDTFSDRLIIFLFHFAFFLNVFKSDSIKQDLQKIFDFIFWQLELSIREVGYGDATINKKMKNYINIFYSIISSIERWDELNYDKKNEILHKYIKINKNSSILINYFDNYKHYLKKNTLNSLLKGVIKLNF